ncbi:MAG: STAS domain-containing protein [Planctomycetota bacterium]|jgi:ABC-type transporter Mla MlaB component
MRSSTPHVEFLPSARRRLVAVDHNVQAPCAKVSTRIRALAPWADTTAAVVIRTIQAHARPGATVLVDLGGCAHADTSQLAVLIAGLRHAQQSKATMVVSTSPQLRQLAAICRIDHVLSWASDAPATRPPSLTHSCSRDAPAPRRATDPH